MAQQKVEVRRELDAEGRDSGIELEETKAEQTEIKEPFDPKLIDVTTETRSLDVIIKRIEAGHIDLDPDFQRSRGIWTATKKSLLIESLLLRIPLPTFYVAEIETDEEGELGGSSWAVVDGIQRLSTIVEFVKPTALELEPLVLSGLEYLDSENGKTFDQLSTALRLRLLESQFTMQVIRVSTPELVQLNIFARINTGGVPLSAQELRHALIPGKARRILADLANSDAFQTAVSGSVSPSRMGDREMALRFLAFRMSDPERHQESDFDDFLRSAMRSINDWTDLDEEQYIDEFSAAMNTAAHIFGDDAFRKRYEEDDARKPISKALFEAMAVGLAQTRERRGDEAISALIGRSTLVKRSFMTLMKNRDFERAISQGTGDPVRVRERFRQIREMLERVLDD